MLRHWNAVRDIPLGGQRPLNTLLPGQSRPDRGGQCWCECQTHTRQRAHNLRERQFLSGWYTIDTQTVCGAIGIDATFEHAAPDVPDASLHQNIFRIGQSELTDTVFVRVFVTGERKSLKSMTNI